MQEPVDSVEILVVIPRLKEEDFLTLISNKQGRFVIMPKDGDEPHERELEDYVIYMPTGNCGVAEIIRQEMALPPGSLYIVKTLDELQPGEKVYETVEDVEEKVETIQAKGVKRPAAQSAPLPVQCPEVMEGDHDVAAPESTVQGDKSQEVSAERISSRRHSLDSKIQSINKKTFDTNTTRLESSKNNQQVSETRPQKRGESIQQKLPRMKKTKRTMTSHLPKEGNSSHLQSQVERERLKQRVVEKTLRQEGHPKGSRIMEKTSRQAQAEGGVPRSHRIMEKVPRQAQQDEGLSKSQIPRQRTQADAAQPPVIQDSLSAELLDEISGVLSSQIADQVLQQQIQPVLQMPTDIFYRFPTQLTRNMFFEVLNYVVVQTPQMMLQQLSREMLQQQRTTRPTLQMTLQEVAEKILHQILQAIPEQAAQHIPNLVLQQMSQVEDSERNDVAYTISEHVINEIAEQIPRYTAGSQPGHQSRIPQQVTEPRGLHNIPEYTMHAAPTMPHPVPKVRHPEAPDTTEVVVAQVQLEPIPPPMLVPEQTLQQKLQQTRKRVH